MTDLLTATLTAAAEAFADTLEAVSAPISERPIYTRSQICQAYLSGVRDAAPIDGELDDALFGLETATETDTRAQDNPLTDSEAIQAATEARLSARERVRAIARARTSPAPVAGGDARTILRDRLNSRRPERYTVFDLPASIDTVDALLLIEAALSQPSSEGELARLRAALKPFADKADLVDDDTDANYTPDWSPFIPIWAYRNARKALATRTDPPEWPIDLPSCAFCGTSSPKSYAAECHRPDCPHRHEKPVASPLSPDKLAKLRELLAQATAGPWKADDGDVDLWGIFDVDGAEIAYAVDPTLYLKDGAGGRPDRAKENIALIVAAINALPALLALADGRNESHG